MSELTEALGRLNAGDQAAIEAAFQSSYGELKRLAHARLYAANAGNRFATESLLHESFFKLSHMKSAAIPDRKHFFALASTVMRNLILDEVRAANAARRGSGEAALTLHTELGEIHSAGNDVEAINTALEDLRRASPELAVLVEMKFFGGLTEVEIADALGISERTVRREWEKARATLLVLLES